MQPGSQSGVHDRSGRANLAGHVLAGHLHCVDDTHTHSSLLSRTQNYIDLISPGQLAQVGGVWLQEFGCFGMGTRLCGIGMRLQ